MFGDPWNPPSKITWSQSDVSEEAIDDTIDKDTKEKDFFGTEHKPNSKNQNFRVLRLKKQCRSLRKRDVNH